MKHALDYKALISEENHLIFVIPFQAKKPREPFLVYNGGEHALLYRNSYEPLLLDYLHEDAAYLLKYATEVLVIEMVPESDDVVFEYKVSVIHTEIVN